MAADAFLRSTLDGGRLVLAPAGEWTAQRAGEIEPLVDAVVRERPQVERVDIDARGIERLDTVGAWLVERLRRAWADAGVKTAIVGLAPHYQVLLSEVAQSNLKALERQRPTPAIRDALEHIGGGVADTWDDVVAIVRFFGAVIVAAGRVVVHPHNFRFTSIVHHVDTVGFRAVPIIVLIQFLIGAILAQQGIFHFSKFGAEPFVVDMIGILVLREVGVLIVSIMVAGRSGSAYTAEIGSMKMQEEIDALRVMGFDPVQILILPKLTALVIALPLLTFIGSMSALFGGGIVCWLYGGFAPEVFIERLREVISIDTFRVGMIKAPFMALVIGLVACVEGLRVAGSADSLGYHTTSSVVKAIFLVIVLDGLFAMFFAGINM